MSITTRSAIVFSSRRRHTRLVSDWSSDVCSSDLHLQNGRYGDAQILKPETAMDMHGRQEEIGRASCRKECRSWWSAYHYKKKSYDIAVTIMQSTIEVRATVRSAQRIVVSQTSRSG